MANQDCESIRSILDAYADGEVDALLARRVEEHLEGCPECTSALQEIEDAITSVRKSATHYDAPKHLQKNIRSMISRESKSARSSYRWMWRPLFGGGLFVLGALVAIMLIRSGDTEREFGEELVTSHVRSLQQGHLLDVVSTDKHTVKPWFAGKIDFAFDVQDFADQGFPLLGGRLDYLENHQVAVLVYGHGKHMLNVYVAPNGELPHLTQSPIRGFRILQWEKQNVEFLAISDMDKSELEKLKALVGEQ
jgi:anti-sigma factor (TIGR02949 family)